MTNTEKQTGPVFNLPAGSKAGGDQRPFPLIPAAADSATALKTVAATAADRLPRVHLPSPTARWRAAVLATNLPDLRAKLAALAIAAGSDGVWRSAAPIQEALPVAFLFTGHGAQTSNMARQLYETEPIFRQAITECEVLLQPLLQQPLTAALYPDTPPDPAGDPMLNGMTYSQPAIFAVEYALATLWQSWGIRPAVVMGHSVGEYVAACVAGLFSLADGLKLVAARGRLMDTLSTPGQMVAVFANEERVNEAIAPYRDRVSLAVINGDTNIVISGDKGAVDDVVARLKTDRVKVRPLAVAQASHSPLLDPILDAFTETAASIQYRPPRLQYVSCLSGRFVAGEEVMSATYWRRHLREPVRFAAAMQSLHQAGYRHFLETGPAPVLLRMGKRCLPRAGQAWLPSLDPKKGDWHSVNSTLAQLYTLGAQVNWAAVLAPFA